VFVEVMLSAFLSLSLSLNEDSCVFTVMVMGTVQKRNFPGDRPLYLYSEFIEDFPLFVWSRSVSPGEMTGEGCDALTGERCTPDVTHFDIFSLPSIVALGNESHSL
jgi:hypothetical protein